MLTRGPHDRLRERAVRQAGASAARARARRVVRRRSSRASSQPMVDALLRDRAKGSAQGRGRARRGRRNLVPGVPVRDRELGRGSPAHLRDRDRPLGAEAQPGDDRRRAADRRGSSSRPPRASSSAISTGIVIRASHAAQRVTGENPLLRAVRGRVPAADRRRSAGGAHRASSSRCPVRRPRVARSRCSGAISEPLVLLLSAGPVLGSGGEPLGCVISFVDVTESKRAARGAPAPARAGERGPARGRGGEPREGRVPRDARPRAAQPARADPDRARGDEEARRRTARSASAT